MSELTLAHFPHLNRTFNAVYRGFQKYRELLFGQNLPEAAPMGDVADQFDEFFNLAEAFQARMMGEIFLTSEHAASK